MGDVVPQFHNSFSDRINRIFRIFCFIFNFRTKFKIHNRFAKGAVGAGGRYVASLIMLCDRGEG